jgi:hypothetical protein
VTIACSCSSAGCSAKGPSQRRAARAGSPASAPRAAAKRRIARGAAPRPGRPCRRTQHHEHEPVARGRRARRRGRARRRTASCGQRCGGRRGGAGPGLQQVSTVQHGGLPCSGGGEARRVRAVGRRARADLPAAGAFSGAGIPGAAAAAPAPATVGGALDLLAAVLAQQGAERAARHGPGIHRAAQAVGHARGPLHALPHRRRARATPRRGRASPRARALPARAGRARPTPPSGTRREGLLAHAQHARGGDHELHRRSSLALSCGCQASGAATSARYSARQVALARASTRPTSAVHQRRRRVVGHEVPRQLGAHRSAPWPGAAPGRAAPRGRGSCGPPHRRTPSTSFGPGSCHSGSKSVAALVGGGAAEARGGHAPAREHGRQRRHVGLRVGAAR